MDIYRKTERITRLNLLEIDDPAPICDCTLHPHSGRHLPALTTDKVSGGEAPELSLQHVVFGAR